jgi:hypothetical protein
MVSLINDALMKFEKRAEGGAIEKLAETFVDIGPLFTLLGGIDHQVVNGRRGTGKTHALIYLAETKRRSGDVSIFCDLRTIGSNTSMYADPNIPLTERATRLLMDVLTALHNGLYEFLVVYAENLNLSVTGPLLDAFADSIGEVKVQGAVQVEQKTSEKTAKSTEKGASVATDLKSISAGLSAKKSASSLLQNCEQRLVVSLSIMCISEASCRRCEISSQQCRESGFGCYWMSGAQYHRTCSPI